MIAGAVNVVISSFIGEKIGTGFDSDGIEF